MVLTGLSIHILHVCISFNFSFSAFNDCASTSPPVAPAVSDFGFILAFFLPFFFLFDLFEGSLLLGSLAVCLDSSLSPDAADCFSVFDPLASLEPELFSEPVAEELPSVTPSAEAEETDGWTLAVADVEVELTVDVVVPAPTCDVEEEVLEIVCTLGVPMMLTDSTRVDGALNPV